MSIRILIADDHQIFRDGLRPLLESQPDMQVVAEAEDGHGVLDLAGKTRPDVVIMDISMPGLNGVDATRRLMQEPNPPKVVALSMHSDRRFVLGMLKAGATAYLLKDCGFDELAGVIRDVLAGKICLGSRINDSVIQEYIRMAREQEGAGSPLTPREREVLQLLAEGMSTKEIADRLCISVKTVETHRKQVMDKLDLHSVAELTKYAIREGLTSLE